MIALITGGAGFIGSHLADRLISEGHEVYALDDLSTGSVHNIDHLKENPLFHFQLGSVTDELIVGEMVDRADVVFHLAAAVGVKLVMERPGHTISTNVRGTEVVLRAAAKKKKLVQLASTSEVYGKTLKIPFNEEDDLLLGPPTRIRWGYACSKAIDEYLGLAYHDEFDLPIIITRFFNTVGPRQTGEYGMVLPTFVRQALAGKDITVYGTGEQNRCFGYVADVTESLMRLIRCEKAYGHIFNIGSEQEISMLALAELVKKKTNSASKTVLIPYDQAYIEGFEDVARRVPDIRKLHECIDYHPDTPIDTIVDRVIAYEMEKMSS